MLANLFNYYKNCLNFRGRLNRLGYLKCNLALIALLVVVGGSFIVFNFLIAKNIPDSITIKVLQVGFVVVGGLTAIFAITASIIISIRRLHDVNLNGWWFLWLYLIQIITAETAEFSYVMGNAGSVISLFLSIIPLVIFLGYFLLQGTQGENKYGKA